MPWLIATYFFLELATRLEYKAVQIFTTRFEYIICNAFESFQTHLKHYQRVLNIITLF